MSIGTSKGGFYDDQFHLHAGINTDPSVDNNVIDPDVDPEGMKPKPEFTIVPQPVSDIKVNPHVTITDEDIDKAMGLGMSFSGGGLGTKAWSPHPSEPLVVRGEPTHGPDISREDMYREMSTNDLHQTAANYRQEVLHGDLGDLHENLPLNEIDRRDAFWDRASHDQFEQQPFVFDNEAANIARRERLSAVELQKNEITNAKSVFSKEGLELKRLAKDGKNHAFGFMNDEGKMGNIELSEKNGGKNLYVEWIGGVGDSFSTINEFGNKNIKNLLQGIKEQFPKAETIAGFRVSGARANTGSGPARAFMRLRPPADE